MSAKTWSWRGRVVGPHTVELAEPLPAQTSEVEVVARERTSTARSPKSATPGKSPDAIHLATAMLIGADVFLAGDAQLERCTEVHVVTIDAASHS